MHSQHQDHYSTQQHSSSHAAPRYSGTSSAFSASANPNEDWTKISDLAERRRIQNRIAQRNYRKKLKKRLEDLERRAASSSVSPEPKPAELHQAPRRKSEHIPSSSRNSSLDISAPSRPAEASRSQFLSVGDSHQLFSQQFTRQLSTSPPPFTYPAYATEPTSYNNAIAFSQVAYTPGFSQPCADVPLYSSYLPTPSPSYSSLPGTTYQPIKQEMYAAEEDINPFNMTFASIAGLDVTAANAYSDSNPQTPPLLEAFELSSLPDSPLDSLNHPLTPALMPTTPTLTLADCILTNL